MRKINQKIIDKKVIQEILQTSEICRLGLNNEGFPYVLPFNYGYSNNCIYIHSAPAGKKIDILKENPNVCFEVEQTAKIAKNESACKWATTYRSIVGYGKIEIIKDFKQKQKGLQIIMAHNGGPQLSDFELKQVDAVVVLKLEIESLTAKQSSNWEKVHELRTLNLETERLSLSEVNMDDLENIYQLESIPEVDEFNTLGIPESIEVTETQLKFMIKDRYKTPRPSYTWKICLKDSGKFIGLAGFFLSNDKFKLGEIYYKFHPDYWGRGYATEVAKQLIKTGFEVFDLQKVEAGVATGNFKSIRVLEKSGMTREGLRRKILPIRGEWKDNYHYAIVKDDPRDY